LAVVASGRYYPHYFIELVPALGLLAGFAVATGLAADTEMRRWQLAVLGVLFLLPGLNWLRDAADALARSRHASDARSRVVSTLGEVSRPDETVLVWGADDALYFLSGRRAASRYTYKFPLLRSHSGDYASEQRRVEFLAEIERRQPAVVVVSLGSEGAAGVDRELRDVGLAPVLERDYVGLMDESLYRMLVRAPSATPPSPREDPP
jgi:hypothetical protein